MVDGGKWDEGWGWWGYCLILSRFVAFVDLLLGRSRMRRLSGIGGTITDEGGGAHICADFFGEGFFTARSYSKSRSVPLFTFYRAFVLQKQECPPFHFKSRSVPLSIFVST